MVIKPNALPPGGTIGIIAPSSWVVPEHLTAATEHLQQKGYRVVVHPQTTLRDTVSAGNVQQRLDALHDYFADPSIHAIITATGGVRGMRLLDQIDYDLVRQNPKLFIGYSDTTFLLSALYHRAGISVTHGPSLMGFRPENSALDQENLLQFMEGNYQGDLFSAATQPETLQPGEATGVLFGGNLSLLINLLAMGGAYAPSLKNTLLMIEDVGEEIRQVDRLLSVLRLSGALDHLSGLIVGHMTDIGNNGDKYKFESTLREVIADHVQGRELPVIIGAPFGHEAPNAPFPIGLKAQLTAPKNGRPTLKLLESPFSDL